MTLRKHTPGEPFRPDAAEHAVFVDAAADYLKRMQGGQTRAAESIRNTGIVLVKNNTCFHRARFDVLGIEGVFPNPAANPAGYKSGPVLLGVTPTAAHAGNFVILAEPIRCWSIGWGYLSGGCVARINVLDEAHRFADVAAGDSTALHSKATGEAQILWKEPGTGVRLAYVRLSNGDEDGVGGGGGGGGGATTTTTMPPAGTAVCTGQCKWVWNASSQSWSLAEDNCATTTTTTTTTSEPSTTSEPTTTTPEPCDCPTTTTTSEPTSTTSTTTTTTPAPCQCVGPTFCGSEEGECTYTFCGTAGDPVLPDCTTTTTGAPTTTGEPTSTTPNPCDTTTTSTTTLPPGCKNAGCTYVYLPGPSGWQWTPICAECCPGYSCVGSLPSSPQPCQIHTIPCFKPGTTAPPPGTVCKGKCKWTWVPDLAWSMTVDGCTVDFTGDGKWLLVDNQCQPGTLDGGKPCYCDAPTVDGNNCGATATTYCHLPVSDTTTPDPATTTPDPCYTTTTTTTSTTPGPCDGQCKWTCVPVYGGGFMWSQLSGDCPAECPCPPPATECQADCEVAMTGCGWPTTTTSTTGPPTTTSSTTSSTTTSTTTTTPDPCGNPILGYCLFLCSSGTWINTACNCPLGYEMVEPAEGTCTAENEGDCIATDCVTTTTAPPTTTTTTTTPCPEAGPFECSYVCDGLYWQLVSVGTDCSMYGGQQCPSGMPCVSAGECLVTDCLGDPTTTGAPTTTAQPTTTSTTCPPCGDFTGGSLAEGYLCGSAAEYECQDGGWVLVTDCTCGEPRAVSVAGPFDCGATQSAACVDPITTTSSPTTTTAAP